MTKLFNSICLLILIFLFSSTSAQISKDSLDPNKNFIVGFAGTEPFVIKDNIEWNGFSVEIWQLLAEENKISYTDKSFNRVNKALNELASGNIDAVVGPFSITSDRAELVEFSQPFFSVKFRHYVT